jgi:hypothetical protein
MSTNRKGRRAPAGLSRPGTPGGAPGNQEGTSTLQPPIHVSYKLAKKGAELLRMSMPLPAEEFGPQIGVSVETGKRVVTTLCNLGLAERDRSTRGFILTRSGEALVSSLGTNEEAVQLRAALDRFSPFTEFWGRVERRNRRPDSALLREVLEQDYGAARKSAYNLGSVIFGYAKAAGLSASDAAHATPAPAGRPRSPSPSNPALSTTTSWDGLAPHRLYVLMALAQSTPGKSGELAHKAEIQQLLARGPFLPRSLEGGGLDPGMVARLEETLRSQLVRALDTNSKTGIANILEILESLTRASGSGGGG